MQTPKGLITFEDQLDKDLGPAESKKLRYICDNRRHLICLPYSIDNLHQMAYELNIRKAWFHRGKSGTLMHYDIPKRRIAEITSKCEIVSSKEIVRMILNVR